MGNPVKAASLRFLKIRPRSVMELKEKLAGKSFSEEDIETTIYDLIASGLLRQTGHLRKVGSTIV